MKRLYFIPCKRVPHGELYYESDPEDALAFRRRIVMVNGHLFDRTPVVRVHKLPVGDNGDYIQV